MEDKIFEVLDNSDATDTSVVSLNLNSPMDYYLKKFEFDKKNINKLNDEYESVVECYVRKRIVDKEETVKRLLTVKSQWGNISNIFILDYELYVLTSDESENTSEKGIYPIYYSFDLEEVVEKLDAWDSLVSEEDLEG